MTDRTGVTAYLALGSNIAPTDNIPQCLGLLGEIPMTRIGAESSWYRTEPWGIEEQAEFINLVVELETRLSARALLGETQAIERRLGRSRTVKNGPRTIDLDILLYGASILAEGDLVIPHPGLVERDFMLVPLLEIAPEATHPITGERLSGLLEQIRYRQIIAQAAPSAGD